MNAADTTWMLISTALVLLMTPALAFFLGALLTGVFAQNALNGVSDGLLFGNPGQVGIQVAAVLSAAIYSGVASFILLKVVGVVFPLRASDADQSVGLDGPMHGEEAYVHSGGSTAAIG